MLRVLNALADLRAIVVKRSEAKWHRGWGPEYEPGWAVVWPDSGGPEVYFLDADTPPSPGAPWRYIEPPHLACEWCGSDDDGCYCRYDAEAAQGPQTSSPTS